MSNYNPNTLNRIGSITTGVHVKTGVLNNSAYLTSGDPTHSLFNVYGRIRILGLDVEAVTAFAADLTTVKFTFTSTTPSVGISDISALSLSIASIPIGAKVKWLGTAVNTAPAVGATQAHIAAFSADTMDVGHTNGIGVISKTAAAAVQGSGTCRFNLYYLPISEGAYATAIV